LSFIFFSKKYFVNHYFSKTTSLSHSSKPTKMADQNEIAKFTKPDNGLPVQPQLKITAKSVFAGNPRQIADLLVAGVAQAVVEIKKTKSNIPLYMMKLRCATLWTGNLDVIFLLDWPNQKLMDDGSGLLVSDMKQAATEDQDRADEYKAALDVALSYWNVRMEEVVHQLFPDRTPIQCDSFANDSILQLKTPNPVAGQEFKLSEFLAGCVHKNGTPGFKISFGWVGTSENRKTTDTLWGFKYELYPWPQYHSAPARSRAPARSAAERQATAIEKRKRLAEEISIVEDPELKEDV
jgi:hypothetical protein